MDTPATTPCDVLRPEPDEARIRSTCGPPLGRAGDSAEVTLRLVQEHDRIAKGLNDIVVHRLFSAGLCLETVLGLMGDQPGAAKIRDAISELDLAIRDFRNVLYRLTHLRASSKVAEVVRDLELREREAGLSAGERRMLDKVRHLRRLLSVR